MSLDISDENKLLRIDLIGLFYNGSSHTSREALEFLYFNGHDRAESQRTIRMFIDRGILIPGKSLKLSLAPNWITKKLML